MCWVGGTVLLRCESWHPAGGGVGGCPASAARKQGTWRGCLGPLRLAALGTSPTSVGEEGRCVG